MTHFEKQNTNSQIINLFKSNKAISEIQNKIKIKNNDQNHNHLDKR